MDRVTDSTVIPMGRFCAMDRVTDWIVIGTKRFCPMGRVTNFTVIRSERFRALEILLCLSFRARASARVEEPLPHRNSPHQPSFPITHFLVSLRALQPLRIFPTPTALSFPARASARAEEPLPEPQLRISRLLQSRISPTEKNLFFSVFPTHLCTSADDTPLKQTYIHAIHNVTN